MMVIMLLALPPSLPQVVLTDHQDVRRPRIAFFAANDIPAGTELT